MTPKKNLINSIYLPLSGTEGGARLGEYYNGDFHTTYFSLARHALKEGLRSLGLKKNDKVLLPSFICRDVLAPFNELGIDVDFYGLDEKLNLIKKPEELPFSNAILAVHYFGLETDLTPFVEYSKRHHAYLIEDNAHGLFSRNLQNELLGTKGDIGIISIRKTLPLQNGAMLIQASQYKKVKQPKIHDYISRNLKIKNNLRPLVALLGISFLLKVTKFKRLLRKLTTGNEFPLSCDSDEKIIPFEANPVDVEKRVSHIDFNAEVKRRRELFFFIAEFMKNEPVKALRKNITLGEVPYSFPFYCESSQIANVKNKLESIGLEVVKWPSLPTSILKNEFTPAFYHSLYLIKFIW